MLFTSFIVALVLFVQLFHSNEAGFNFDEYKCAVCVPTFQYMIDHKDANFQQACETYFPGDICGKFDIPNHLQGDVPRKSARELCEAINVCPKADFVSGAADVDIRVARAMGNKGYNQVRVSVISNGTVSSPYFDYSQQFKYRWTNKYLNTGLVSVTPGQHTTLNIAGKSVNIYLPKENEGTRGVLIADPCITSKWIVCAYKEKYDTFNRFSSLINAINARDDSTFYQILGDNFYDQDGDVSSTFFGSLTDAAKARFLYTTPGNHDFWVNASPKLAVPMDQYGNGIMQFYGQDTKAATSGSPFDFSVNPDGNYGNDHGENVAAASNFFFYNKIGNIGFIGYSGAHSYESMIPYFTEACEWAQTANPAVLLLVGHWNSDGDGCESSATVPNVYQEMKSLPACAPVANKLKYFMGHKHCNYITEADNGYMIGGAGMSDKDCMGDFGFTVVDTFDNKFRVYYFPVAHASDYDNYDTIINCIQANGVSGCYHLATKWTEVSL
jgi:hypothetical protein